MSAIDTLRDALFGNPPSPTMEPSREGVLAAFDEAVRSISSIAGGIVATEAMAVYATEAILQSHLEYDDRALGVVYADGDPDSIGIYIKEGGSGVGSWQFTGLLGRGPGPSDAQIDLAFQAYVGQIEENVASAIDAATKAALSASVAESAAGPTYPDTSTGLAATTNGQSFAVDNGDGTVTVYLNVSGVATEQRTLATTDYIFGLLKVDPTARVTALGDGAWESGEGEDNVILGQDAGKTLNDAGTALGNAKGLTLVGAYAGADGSFASDFATAVGYQALRTSDFAYCFTGIGLRVGYNIDGDEGTGAGGYITAIGTDAGLGVTTGKNSTFVGAKCGLNVASGTTPVNGGITGENNTGVGTEAFHHLESGSHNCAFGGAALRDMTVSSYNVGIGAFAGRDITTSSNNVVIGGNAGYRLTTGLSGNGSNVVVGFNALSASDTGATYENLAVGKNALAAYSGPRATAVGADALMAATSSATFSTGIGYRAGYQVTTAPNGTFLGYMAGGGITTQSSVTAVGAEAMAAATCAFSAGLGRRALYANTGSMNTAVGYNAHNDANAYNNCTTLGYNAQPTGSNQVTLGDANVTTLRCAVTTITALSDVRCKKEIHAAPEALGLDLVRALPVRTFRWKEAAANVPQGVGLQIGMIAQEWDEALSGADAEWLGVIDKSNPDRWEAAPHKMFFSMLMAVQQLAARVEELEARLAT